LEPPIITHVSPPFAPLGVENIALTLIGGNFDPGYEYFCDYRIALTYQN